MVIDSESQFEALISHINSDWIVIPIMLDHKKHPALNSLCLLYFYVIDSNEEFVLIVDHFDSIFSVTLEKIFPLFLYENKKYVFHKKDLLFYIPNQVNTYDLDIKAYLNSNEVIPVENTPSQEFFYRKFHQFTQLNKLVPLYNLIDYCSQIKDNALPFVNKKDDISLVNYNEVIIPVIHSIESAGLFYDKKIFQEFYPQKKLILNQDYLYTQYNLFTSTGRPSNKFGGINYAALNKENGIRKMFISRFGLNGELVEFDFDAYHLQLIANEIGFKFPTEMNIHEYLGRIYFGKDKLSEDEYLQSKQISFRLLYGGIDKDFEQIDFFYEVNKYINKFFGELKKNTYINTPVFKRRFDVTNMEDFNKYKTWNYLIQLLETEQSFYLMDKLSQKIKDFKSKLMLYTYDSFLFDIVLDEKEELIKIVNETMQTHNFRLKVKTGINYHELKTEK